MKLVSLVIGLMLITGCAMADVTGEIVSIDQDANGSIRVWSQYKIDDVEIASKYPKIDGKSVYCSRYSVTNFAGMSDTEIKARIVSDVDVHTQSLISKTFIKKANTDILDNHLKDVIGSKVIKDNTTIKVSDTKEWIIKTDGTKIEKDITPIVIK